MLCADVIGVYEPMIVVDVAGVRRTALAAEPHAALSGDAHYHAACYTTIQQHHRPSGDVQ
jgi:hypothetical protein